MWIISFSWTFIFLTTIWPTFDPFAVKSTILWDAPSSVRQNEPKVVTQRTHVFVRLSVQDAFAHHIIDKKIFKKSSLQTLNVLRNLRASNRWKHQKTKYKRSHGATPQRHNAYLLTQINSCGNLNVQSQKTAVGFDRSNVSRCSKPHRFYDAVSLCPSAIGGLRPCQFLEAGRSTYCCSGTRLIAAPSLINSRRAAP